MLMATLVMFSIVMFIVNPAIDKGNGLEVISLQLAYDKDIAKTIIRHWDIATFKRWIFTDYLYALSYSLFFASLIFWLMKRKGKSGLPYILFAYVAVSAGALDWLENTLELKFLDDVEGFPKRLFFFHSIVATLKWLALPIVLAGIALLCKQPNKKEISAK